jgi:hypothetical protein
MRRYLGSCSNHGLELTNPLKYQARNNIQNSGESRHGRTRICDV